MAFIETQLGMMKDNESQNYSKTIPYNIIIKDVKLKQKTDYVRAQQLQNEKKINHHFCKKSSGSVYVNATRRVFDYVDIVKTMFFFKARTVLTRKLWIIFP